MEGKLFVLRPRKIKKLNVQIGDKTYGIPLAEALTLEEAAKLNTVEGTRAYINRFIPAEVARTLTIGDYNDITAAWVAASGETKHESAGES